MLHVAKTFRSKNSPPESVFATVAKKQVNITVSYQKQQRRDCLQLRRKHRRLATEAPLCSFNSTAALEWEHHRAPSAAPPPYTPSTFNSASALPWGRCHRPSRARVRGRAAGGGRRSSSSPPFSSSGARASSGRRSKVVAVAAFLELGARAGAAGRVGGHRHRRPQNK